MQNRSKFHSENVIKNALLSLVLLNLLKSNMTFQYLITSSEEQNYVTNCLSFQGECKFSVWNCFETDYINVSIHNLITCQIII